MSVPKSVKSIFDKFPLKVYDPVENNDAAMAFEISSRTAYFQGDQSFQANYNATFQLGVYQMIEEAETGIMIASDPFGLFAELSLCKKNCLDLPRKISEAPVSICQHSMVILSPRASIDKVLPVLIEGTSTRHIRSCKSINEILFSRVESPELILHLKLLNTTVYDGYTADLLFNVPDEDFCRLYCYINEKDQSFSNKLMIHEQKVLFLARNDFSLRNPCLAHLVHNSKTQSNLNELIDLCIITLSKFQSWIQSIDFEGHTRDSYDYIHLALASYILAIVQLGHNSRLYNWVQTDGLPLLKYARSLLISFQKK